MARFAEGTEVSVEKSRAEIEKLLAKYGAKAFGYMATDTQATLAFQASERNIRFSLRLPPISDFTHDGRRMRRTPERQREAKEAACRRLWRALCLVIKAKLEAVASGVSVFEDEFMAHIVLPSGLTVSEEVRPRIAAAYEGNTVPMLPNYTSKP